MSYLPIGPVNLKFTGPIKKITGPIIISTGRPKLVMNRKICNPIFSYALLNVLFHWISIPHSMIIASYIHLNAFFSYRGFGKNIFEDFAGEKMKKIVLSNIWVSVNLNRTYFCSGLNTTCSDNSRPPLMGMP